MSKRSKYEPDIASISWALTHLDKFGDSDILPIPLEYKACFLNRGELAKRLSSLNMVDYSFRAPLRIAVPKVKGGFRIASTMEPADCIYYTALSYDTTETLEKIRTPRKKSVSCSYRINTTEDGDFFHGNTGYRDFQTATRNHILSGHFDIVLSLDLSDFYSQISHHRLRNNLDSSSITSELSLAIENCLNDLSSNQHSQGIPVGPSASIILAEAALLDIDQHLISKGYTFCRYVDDFRLFFKDKRDAVIAFRELTEILFRNHRLPINSNKTKLWSIGDFRKYAFVDEEQMEESKNTEIVDEFVDSLSSSIANDFELHEHDEAEIERTAIERLFQKVEDDEILPLGLSKFVLRRSRTLKISEVAENILRLGTRLIPILRDVCLYFDVVAKNQTSGCYRKYLRLLRKDEAIWSLPYVQQWWFGAVLKNPKLFVRAEVMYALESADSLNVERFKPLLLAQYGMWDEIRNLKDQVDAQTSWGKRAIILATCALSDDEKRHWLGRFKIQDDPITWACARYSADHPNLNKLLT